MNDDSLNRAEKQSEDDRIRLLKYVDHELSLKLNQYVDLGKMLREKGVYSKSSMLDDNEEKIERIWFFSRKKWNL